MRTLLDRAATTTPHRVERLVHRAAHLGLIDASYDPAGRRGARRLRAAIAALQDADPQITRSELEERLLELVVHAGLPAPLVNARVAGLEVDFFWPELGLVVETDGAAIHGTPAALLRDREREAILRLAGFEVLRFSWRQVVDQATLVVAVLRTAAAAARG